MQHPNASTEPKKRHNVTGIVSAVVGLGLLAVLAFAFFAPSGGRPAQGEPAPDFTVTLLDGSKASLSDLRGQVVVLNFWASWCNPCRQEAPALQRVWETYRDRGVLFVGVSYKDAEDASRAFVQEFGLTYPNGTDLKGDIGRTYGVTGVPETFIIDAQGRVARFYLGEIQAEELAQSLAQMTGQ
jgi:cytochrome c biogenesis protein CcmG/thiol:disulfide interchange protein DsbE